MRGLVFRHLAIVYIVLFNLKLTFITEGLQDRCQRRSKISQPGCAGCSSQRFICLSYCVFSVQGFLDVTYLSNQFSVSLRYLSVLNVSIVAGLLVATYFEFFCEAMREMENTKYSYLDLQSQAPIRETFRHSVDVSSKCHL